MVDKLTLNITNCARCNENHENLEFYEFTNPIYDSDETIWNYWALCPTLNEPILMKIIEEETNG